jgi:hypothetical protein
MVVAFVARLAAQVEHKSSGCEYRAPYPASDAHGIDHVRDASDVWREMLHPLRCSKSARAAR